MPRILHDLKIGLDEELSERLQWMVPGHQGFRIIKQSVDARQRHNPHFVYSVEVAETGETLPDLQIDITRATKKFRERPIVVGTGPAGLFAALRFVERGVPCLLLERGSRAEERIKGINKYWRNGDLDPRNNVCIGEGGAGLYSDGKLITRIKSPHIPYVMDRLVQFGAPEEIKWLSNPHVGSDRIRRVIPKLREYLLANGCEIRYDCAVSELLYDSTHVFGVLTEHGDRIESEHVVLATGHSAEDILRHLHAAGVAMEGKSFALGLRVEHPQAAINKIQYRDAWEHPKLGSANYKLTHHDHRTGVGVYSFCMCPGGYVLSSGTEADGMVCNGMSNYNRNSPFANSAVVVSIDHASYFGSSIMGGLDFRRELERQFFAGVIAAGGKRELPAQSLLDFMGARAGEVRKGSSPSGAIPVRLDQLLPGDVRGSLIKGFENFERSMKNFISPEAQLYGVESRTSCPVRVVRDDVTLMSVSHSGLFPAGEGAGYAGGITSAACDGVRIADRICDF